MRRRVTVPIASISTSGREPSPRNRWRRSQRLEDVLVDSNVVRIGTLMLRGPRRRDLPGRGEAIEVRHPDVHQDDVRVSVAAKPAPPAPVAASATTARSGAVHHHPKSGADQFLVIGEQNPDRATGRRLPGQVVDRKGRS